MTNVVPTMDNEAVRRNAAKKASGLKIGSGILCFQPEELDELFTEKARTELRETPDVVAQALAELRELVKGEPDFIVPDVDEFYKRFLRPCKWYPKSAFNLMRRFYNFIRIHPRYCNDLVPSNERTALISGILTPLPYRGQDGTRLLLIECGKKWKPKEVTLDQIFRAVMLVLYAAIAEPKSQVGGARVILDMDGLSVSQVTYFTPTFAAAVVEWVQKCLPCRLKGIHIINQPFVFNMVFAIFKPLIQEKLRNRIHFHGTERHALLTFIGSRFVPKRYGGEMDFPDEKIGEPLFQYLCSFEDQFITAKRDGYVTKT